MSFPSCFRPSKTSDDHHHPPPPPPALSAATLTTYTYHTDAGTVSLTWSRSILGRSLHLHHHQAFNPSSTFHLRIKRFPFLFNNNKRRGSKSLSHNTRIFWNLSKARFGSGPEPTSNYFLALTVDNASALLVGDASLKDACAACKARDPKNRQILIMKKEHVDVVGKRVYLTRARFGGKTRELEVEYYGDDGEENSRLLFCFDGVRVLEVKRLKWKFRGNERVEVGDGAHVRITWDVHNWMFQKEEHDNSYKSNNVGNGGGDGHAVFMFKFEEDEVVGVLGGKGGEGGGWVEQSWNDLQSWEWGKTGKSWSSSSLSMSSSAGSFGGSCSVMEWSSVEESELVVPVGFTLLVHAWRR